MRLRAYIAGVIVIATAITWWTVGVSQTVPHAIQAVALLAVLGLVAELLGFALPRSAGGSLSFIPYLAAVVIVPRWEVPVGVAILRLLLDLAARRSPEKALFNGAQHAVSQSAALAVYVALGGQSLLLLREYSLSSVTSSVGFAAIAAFSVALATNSLLVSIAVALSTNAPVRRIWRENSLATIGLDITASPLIFVFAWVYASFGPLAAATLWVPILGLREVYKANLELDQMNQELLQLMVKSIEARDPYTSGHSRRVRDYALIIARGLRLSDREVARIGQAALLHDVGKINEKYHPILTKPDRLSADEWLVMKEHPADGASLVSTMTRLRHLVPAIRHHHENWDGTGYPDGIAGELIPLEARVIALADTIDAMTSERPYRPGLTQEQVRAEIVRCRGQQFDPEMADRVLSSDVWARLFPHRGLSETTRLRIVGDTRVAV